MTLAEFLHPIRKASKREQVVASLYYLKYENRSQYASVREIRDALVQANIPRSRNANLSDVLARLIPLVNRMGEGYWEITDTGTAYVREQLGVVNGSPQTQEDITTLIKLSQGVAEGTAREYVDEAIKCLQVGAYRAAVVFLWSGAVHEIRERVWTSGKTQIESALKSKNPKARFRRKDDFSLIKDSTLIELTGELSIFDKSQRKRLKEGLDLRNDCGHPVKYRPGEKKVSGFIEDVLQIVFEA